MSYTLVPTELIVDGAITSAKLDTNIAISGTLGVTGEVTLATHLVMGDNDKIKIGTGGDLEIYHDGSNSYISNSTGNIYLGDTNGAVHIQAKLNEESIICAADGAVSLYYDNAVKLATSSAGVSITGTLAATLSTAAQPNITSVGTLTGFTSTGIDDNATSTAITIDSSENVQIGSNSFAAPRLQLYAAATGESQIFFGNDGTNGFKDGAIRYFHESHATTSDRRNMTFSTANTERMRINATGVGIGTSPVKQLTLAAANTSTVVATALNHGASNYWGVGSFTDQSFRIAKSHGLEDANTYFAIDRSNGNIGLGTSSPSALLDVTVGNAKTANAGVWANLGKTNESSNYQALQCQQVGGSSAGDRRYEFQTIEQGVANAGSIVFQPSGGNVGIGVTSPTSTLDVRGVFHVGASASTTPVIGRSLAPAGSQGLFLTAGVVNSESTTTPTFADNSSSGASIYLGGNAVDQYGGTVVIKAYGSGADGNLITFENRSGTNTFAERMRIDSSGNVTKPTQCNFLARRNGNQTGYNASGSYGDGVRYNSEIYDIGGDFDVTTGIFTAPVDGTYFIQGSVYSNTTGTNWSQAWLAVNNARADYTDMVAADGDTFISTTHLVKLSAGDEVRYHPYYSGSTSVTILANNNHTWFKGYLLG